MTSKLAAVTTIALASLMTVSWLVAAQPRQPTRNVRVAENGAWQPTRNIPSRTPEVTPHIEPQTGTFDLRRQVLTTAPRRGTTRVLPQWRLGVYVDKAPMGIRIREVSRYSPAWRFGLEEGDYLLDIMGYPVGYHHGTFHPLNEALNQFAQQDGWVNVLIWNKRTAAQEAMWLQLERR